MIRGLHHVTATVDGAQEDLDFYVGVLGLRLVKKTVNFDNHAVYHFYYGDEHGTPGTLMTTFPYRGQGVVLGRHGAGQVGTTSFSVPPGSLDAWRERLRSAGLKPRDEGERFGEEVITVEDPSGLVIGLVACDDERTPWVAEGLDAGTAVRGVSGVSLLIRRPGRSIAFLVDVLGWQVAAETAERTRLTAGGDGPGHRIDIVEAADAEDAVSGLGTVHHVAMAVEDAEAQLTMRDRIVAQGHRVTQVLDRQYFRSIYFSEPGGVLYEIATLPPGFTIDEDLDELGTQLKLPEWEEANRVRIEARLPTVSY